jgi:hypothetical protein
MNFRKREVASICLLIERDVVCNIKAGENERLTVWAHKDEELGNQSFNVEYCNLLTGELETSAYNIPADVAYTLRTKELMLIDK